MTIDSIDLHIEEEALAAAASLLRQGRTVHLATLIFMVLVFIAAIFRPGPETIAAAVAALLIGGAETYFAARVGLDGRIFARMEKHAANGRLDLSAFDEGMLLAGLVTAIPPERNLETRIAGAVRLFRRQAALAGLQGIILIIALALQWGRL